MVHKITEEDICTRCWWCGKRIRGYSTELGRDLKPVYEHFCSLDCMIEYQNCEV